MTLRLDIYAADSATATPKWFAATGNAPAEAAVTVRWRDAAPPDTDASTSGQLPDPNQTVCNVIGCGVRANTASASSSISPSAPTDPALGLERYYGYTQVPAGAGMTALTNVATGNLLVHWQPFTDPGVGLSSVFSLTYNSLEQHSDSSVGNNWSAAISTLTRLTEPLDIHPNQADVAAGHNARWINFIDGDGTPHTFTGVDDGNGGVIWRAPAGVHLYLRHFSNSDTTKYWAISRPDNVTFYFTQDGWPTGARDANGNTLTYTLTKLPAGSDPGKPGFEITSVTDSAGRSVAISYYGPNATAHVRGNIATVTDHGGHAINFDYYDDGNLLRITQTGGAQASATGGQLADRSFVFTYQNNSGSGPAISAAAGRVFPDPHTADESSLLYSIRDPNGNETVISDYGPSDAPADRSLVHTLTDRAGEVTTFSYNHAASTTTVVAPGSRSTTYAIDSNGRPTSATDPLNRVTGLTWNADNMTTKVTDPAGHHSDYTYNVNGVPLTISDQLARITTLTYDDRPLDSTDTGAHWSLLATKTSPAGTATTSVAHDFEYDFGHDATGNLTSVTDPTGAVTTYCYNLQVSPTCNPTNDPAHSGTVATATDANGGITKFGNYDGNGYPAKVTDPVGRITQYGFDADGENTFVQTPTHAAPANGDPGQDFRTFFYYDAFHRMGASSQPESYANALGVLIWSSVTFDANNNVVAAEAPTFSNSATDPGNGPTTTTRYDALDRPTLVTGPDKSADSSGTRTRYAYDTAGRLSSVTDPNAVKAGASSPSVMFGYDADDELVSQTVHDINPTTGADNGSRTSVFCYDNTGNQVAAWDALAGLTTPPGTCPTTGSAHLTISGYDAAHQVTSVIEPLGSAGSRTRASSYDLNGNVHMVTDEAGNVTTVSYDQRDAVTKVDAPYNGTHHAVTVYQYDPNGNLTLQASPRSVDANTAHPNYAWYSTRYRYDADNELGIIVEPVDANTPQAYVYRSYDPDGRLASVSLPVSVAPTSTAAGSHDTTPSSGLDSKAITTTTYFDPGWIASETARPLAPAKYTYTATGQQATRFVSTSDGKHLERWEYYPDDKLKAVHDRGVGFVTYNYDPDNQIVHGVSTLGVGDDTQKVALTAAYDGYGEATKTTVTKGSDGFDTYTKYSYTDDGLLAGLDRNGKEGGSSAPALHTDYGYDGADWLTSQTDLNTSACTDNSRVSTAYTLLGLASSQTTARAAAGCTSDADVTYATKQTTARTYFANALLKTLTTTNGAGSTLQNRTASYDDGNGWFVNGNLTKDTFTLNGPSSTVCTTSAGSCTATNTFNARDELIASNDGHGTATTYTLDSYNASDDVKLLAGNLTSVTAGSQTTTYRYSGDQQTSQTTGTTTTKNWYNELGQLLCVTTAAGSSSDCTNMGTDPRLLSAYSYDVLDRVATARANDASGNQASSGSYLYDALGRLAQENETHANGGTGSVASRRANFSYLGLSDVTTDETDSNVTRCTGGNQALTDVKAYSVDASSNRLVLADSNQACGNSPPTSPTLYDYGTDLHGSVSLINSESNSGSSATATYAYTPYGTEDDQTNSPSPLSRGDTLGSGSSSNTSPINPYRYSQKRYDTATATLQTGDRRYDPTSGRYQQPDVYRGALDDLGLSADPINGNRYALAAGNPIGYAETDGHYACRETTCAPPTATRHQRRLAEHNFRRWLDQPAEDGFTAEWETNRQSLINRQCGTDYAQIAFASQQSCTNYWTDYGLAPRADTPLWKSLLVLFGSELAAPALTAAGEAVASDLALDVVPGALRSFLSRGAASAGSETGAAEAGSTEADTFLYQKLSSAGEHLKYGITKNPATRYTSAEMDGGSLNILASGTKSDMLALERSLHEWLPIGPEDGQTFYILKQIANGLRPPPYDW